jgi:hypothetical protein
MTYRYYEAAARCAESLFLELGLQDIDELIEEAIQGQSEDDGCGLIMHTRNSCRGELALLLYYRFRAGDVKEAVFRGALDLAWNHDHWQVLGAARNNLWLLQAMFRSARFPSGEQIAPMVRIWRGTNGWSFDRARRGISWTTDRDAACWFAYRFADSERNPLVITAEVPGSPLIVPSNALHESEVIYFEGHRTATIDGTAEEWQAGNERHNQRKAEREAARKRQWAGLPRAAPD